MKLNYKIITVIVAITVLLCASAFGISAASDEKIDTGTYQVNENGMYEDIATDSENDTESVGDITEGNSKGEDAEDNPTEGTDNIDKGGNIFEDIYAGFEKYSAQITSLLAFIGSIILAIAYKLGLSPLIEKTLTGVLGAIGKLKENVAASEENAERVSSALTERLESAENVITELNAAVAKMSTALEAEEANVNWREQMRTVLTAQIDMLYDIFMTSALPQYQKDAVGERVQSMRSVLVGGGERNDA
ncbi:MAG: hypothetical protein IKC87_03000 [Clostridia bacterium]|nr:hypothetical protein [Clostridia bacterium]